jgi:hypothetical protein
MVRDRWREGALPRIGGLVLLLVLAVGAFEPFYIRIFASDRAALGVQLEKLPYTKLPTLKGFLEDVRTEVPPGVTVVFLAPFPRSEQGYRYAYGRAAWVFAGQRMLPLVDNDDRILHRHLEEADVALAWRTAPPPGFEVIYEHPEGSVSRRIR